MSEGEEEGPQLLRGSPRLFKQERRIVIHCDRPVALRGSNTHADKNAHGWVLSGQLQSDVLTATSATTRSQEIQTDLWADTSTIYLQRLTLSHTQASISAFCQLAPKCGLNGDGSGEKGASALMAAGAY